MEIRKYLSCFYLYNIPFNSNFICALVICFNIDISYQQFPYIFATLEVGVPCPRISKTGSPTFFPVVISNFAAWKGHVTIFC
jgi:hypothetical protein